MVKVQSTLQKKLKKAWLNLESF